MTDALLNQVIGLLVGILSSWLFWRTLLLVKPRIEISPYLVYDPQKKQLMIKVMNRGNRWVTDLQAKFMLSQRVQLEDHSFRTEAIKYYNLDRNTVFALAPKNSEIKPWASFYKVFTFIAVEEHDPRLLLTSPKGHEKRFEFQLITSDALTGTKLVQSAIYDGDQIKTGKYGKDLNVIEMKVQLKETTPKLRKTAAQKKQIRK